MTVLGSKIARIQDSNFRVRANNSNETSLFLDRELANAVGITDNSDMTFWLNKSNLLQMLSYIFSYPGKINYGKNPWTPSLSELRERLDTLDVFFKHQDTVQYTVRGVVQTEERRYFKDLKKSVGISNSYSSFNIRDFLLEGKTRIIFEEQEGQKYIRLEVDDISTVLIPNDMQDAIQEGVPQSISMNKIFFGAPGTGKSYKLDKDRQDQGFDDLHTERVTFYATYGYSQFVGTYKPNVTGQGNDLTYSFVPGPFIRQYVNAIQHPNENFLLIVEEINRANAAAVFGDMFQLLDRKGGESVYGIAVSEDLKKFFIKINEQFQEKNPNSEFYPISESVIKLPKNLFIWATMNSADQGVFPLDTAFKRRWDTEYLGINSNSKEIEHIRFSLKPDADAPVYSWNDLREKINNRLVREFKVNEDKLIGPFYIDKDLYREDNPFAFSKIIESKIIMYLFEDAAKPYRHNFFHVSDALPLTYSNVCQEFYSHGPAVFGIDLLPVGKNSMS